MVVKGFFIDLRPNGKTGIATPSDHPVKAQRNAKETATFKA